MKVTRIGVQAGLKSILFATDFSPAAQRAGGFLAGIGRHSSSMVFILHVLALPAVLHLPDQSAGVKVAHRDAEERLSKAARQLRSENIQAQTILSEDLEPTRVILEIAAGKAADLIVIGTSGLGVPGRLALGSTAHQIIHQSQIPVLTAGPHTKGSQSQHKFQRIVCATDFSEDATSAVEFALSFTQSKGAQMFLCHVLPRAGGDPVDAQELNENFKTQLLKQIPGVAREWCDPECVVDHGYAADGILLLANRVKADLIVLGTRRFSHWFSSIKTGIAFEVIRKAECAVLTIRN